MTVDRPFFIALVDSQTKAILFTGAIFDPQAPDQAQ
jgi:serine protease inhibitor